MKIITNLTMMNLTCGKAMSKTGRTASVTGGMLSLTGVELIPGLGVGLIGILASGMGPAMTAEEAVRPGECKCCAGKKEF